MSMTIYESLTLMISFSSLVVLILSLSFTFTKKK
ncbi:putative holin-like toxin [Lysinibacillus xylanilyticus]